MDNSKTYFQMAEPVWAAGMETEKNMTLGFTCHFIRSELTDEAPLRLCITGSTIYRVFLNGKFLAHGPARAAHGYYRVDCLNLPEELLAEENTLAVEAVGFNVNSFYTLDQPSFLQAELTAGGRVAAATLEDANAASFEAHTFAAVRLTDRIQKVQRYSFQRPFIEAYSLAPGYDSWRMESKQTVSLARTEDKRLLDRRTPYNTYPVTKSKEIISDGTFTAGHTDRPLWKDRALCEISPILKGYPKEELKLCVSEELDGIQTESLAVRGDDTDRPLCREEETLEAGRFVIHDFGRNLTGFLRAEFTCKEDTRIYLVFDEVLTEEGDVSYNRMSCVNAISIQCLAGSYCVETIQPYTFRYLKVMVQEGSADFKPFSVRELKNPQDSLAEFSCDDPVICRIFEAGRETFLQNAVDIYMDCPSRERAGWLCDSFFTSRVEMDLTGKTVVEDAFLENYLLPERFLYLPEGMVAMCYPSDHNDGVFIPNWAMWLIMELEEYQKRNPNQQIAAGMEKRVEGILNYFRPFENEDGLLEDLKGWIFVEWSRANQLVDGVNYPSNMLYAAALMAAGRLYGRPEWIAKGERTVKAVREQSYNGKFFEDHAVRENGCLKRTGDATEVCQYYAFMLGIADRDTYPELFEVLLTKFGPSRNPETTYPEIAAANAFIGNYLRVEILSRYGLAKQILAETKDFFDYMAVRTGTLWENTGAYASCNHGFASHVIHSYYRDLLGVKEIDIKNAVIKLSIPDSGLKRCSGKLPVGSGFLEVNWEFKNGRRQTRVKVPDGYALVLEEENP
ncbi:family 78 glycoside hydrolase catalytic domain [Lachnotalea sp. AF33-28]|uniref:family 78 glycoside hydrolase catalytic domain n=1 Tax=Lachnotalea sp. AF33-28 TaxID=2292046 RepID=UPI001313E590|nr:family 78 glycoside hydrolase catalytic domain [Lachnotalea sp. AF33-28]